MERKIAKLDIDILPRGMAVSGEGGLPTADGAQGGAFRRQYDRYRAKPSSSIDDLVKFLEDPDQVVEEETVAKVEQLTPEQLRELVQKAGGDSRKLRQWAYDKRPGARSAALTALARGRDPRVAPMLIDALGDPDEGVYTAARDGLRFLSRNIDAFGLPAADKRKPDALKAGVQRAKAWYESLNLQVPAYQQYTPPTQ
jgi:HEAT repeat protein